MGRVDADRDCQRENDAQGETPWKGENRDSGRKRGVNTSQVAVYEGGVGKG